MCGISRKFLDCLSLDMIVDKLLTPARRQKCLIASAILFGVAFAIDGLFFPDDFQDMALSFGLVLVAALAAASGFYLIRTGKVS